MHRAPAFGFGRSLLLAAVVGALALPAFADDEVETIDLGLGEPVEVAQAPEPGGQRRADRDRDVEEIVVTATKREQSLEEVPIAVSAFRGEELLQRGVEDLEDLQQVSPSLSVYGSNSTSNGGTLRIRGMGTTGNNPGLESAVGTFIDGIYRSRAGIAFSDLVDVERIEVLRGPQGTLFGKNTSAGAVHIITKKPEFDFGGFASGSVGNYHYRKGVASITGPIIDDVLAYRLAGSWTDRDGFYMRRGSDDRFDGRDRYTLKGQLLWLPDPDVEVRVIADYTEKEESCCPAAYRITSPGVRAALASVGYIAPPDFLEERRVVGTNHDPFEDVEDWGGSVEVNWDLGFATLTSISGYRDFEVERGQDIDFGGADILPPQDIDEKFENWSQEVRLLGTWGDLDWLGGFYVYGEDIETGETLTFGADAGGYIDFLFGSPGIGAFFPQGEGYNAAWEQDTWGWSFFTHNTYHLMERIDLTLGVRYSWEEKEAEGIINGAPVGTISNGINSDWCQGLSTGLGATGDLIRNNVLNGFCDNFSWDGKRIDRELSGTASAAYRWTEDLMTYLSWSRGFKAGGFNLDQESLDQIRSQGMPFFVGDGRKFEPEFAKSWEFGIKSTGLWDGRIVANVALFHTTFSDFQLNSFTGLGFVITNLARVKSRGIEIETFWDIAEGVYATLGATYADTRYGDTLSSENDSLEGRRITHAPPWQGAASLNLEQPLLGTQWTWFSTTSASYRTRHNTGSDLDPEKIQGDFWLINAQAGLRSPEGNWEFSVWGNNIANEDYNSLVFDSVFQAGSYSAFLNAPRTYGATLTAFF